RGRVVAGLLHLARNGIDGLEERLSRVLETVIDRLELLLFVLRKTEVFLGVEERLDWIRLLEILREARRLLHAVDHFLGGGRIAAGLEPAAIARGRAAVVGARRSTTATTAASATTATALGAER